MNLKKKKKTFEKIVEKGDQQDNQQCQPFHKHKNSFLAQQLISTQTFCFQFGQV